MQQTPLLAHANDPLVVELWPGPAPGDAGIEGPEESRIYASTLVGNTRLITNVTRPSLTVYPPPAGKNTGTAMLICPGGGYHELFWELEGEEVVAWLNSQGMAGIILKHRVPRRPGDVKGAPPLGPLLDAQRAVSVVRSRAIEWGIDPHRIGMVGFSVGGHLALATATRFHERRYPPIDAIDAVSCRPDFAVLCYHNYRLAGPECRELVQAATGSGLHVAIPLRLEDRRQRHWLDTTKEVSLGDVADLARACPEADLVVLEALGVENSAFVRDPALAGARVSFEFSRMATVLQQSIPRLLETLGPERLVFGTGMPLKYGKAALLKLELLEATPSVKVRLAHENMDRLLGRK